MKRKRIMLILDIILIVFIYIFIKNTFSRFDAQVPSYEPETYNYTKQINGNEVTDDEKPILITTSNKKSMYIDPLTTNVIIKNENGKTLAQTLPGLEQNSNQIEVKTPLIVNYKVDSFSKPTMMNGYDESILKGTYIIDIFAEGAKVTYMLGQSVISENAIPKYIDQDMYENQIYPKLTTDEQKTLDIYYTYMETKQAYNRSKKINQRNVPLIYNSLYVKGGYTEEDLLASNEKYDVKEEKQKEQVGFTISIVYTLDSDGDLQVIVPLDEIKASGINQLISIDLLPGLLSTKNGNFLVPDGSGAIVDTSTPKTTKVYSKDFANINQEIVGNYDELVSEKLSLPLFANDKIIAFIDNGAEIASLNIQMLGENKLIYPSINIQYSSFYGFSDEVASAGINLSSPQVTGDLKITYKINERNQSFYDYVKITRNYYMDKFDLKVDKQMQPNLYLYALGVYDYTNYFAGIPYTDFNTLTTSEDLQKMADSLSQYQNLKIIYDGWNQEGFSSSLQATQANSQNGDVRTFIENNPNTSLAINLARIESTFSGGYNLKLNAAYNVYGEKVVNYPILNSSFKEDKTANPYYYLSPQYLISAVDNFISNFDLATSILIKDLASIGYASFNQNRLAMPLESEDIIEVAIDNLKASGLEVGMNNPILLRGFQADYIIGLPSTSSQDLIFDYSVPFVQLVYGQLINTSNTSINLSNDGSVRLELLHALETKSSIMFTVAKSGSSDLKNTKYNDMYSSDFEYWLDVINEACRQYNEFLQKIDNGSITDYQVVEAGVSIVTYDNQKQVAFNYNDVAVKVLGQNVSALSYKVLEDE